MHHDAKNPIDQVPLTIFYKMYDRTRLKTVDVKNRNQCAGQCR